MTKILLKQIIGVGAELPRFATQAWLKPFLNSDLELAFSKPILFQPSRSANNGRPAALLADICDAILALEAAS